MEVNTYKFTLRIVRSGECQFPTDVSGQTVGPILKSQVIQEEETNMLSRNVGTELPLLRKTQNSADHTHRIL